MDLVGAPVKMSIAERPRPSARERQVDLRVNAKPRSTIMLARERSPDGPCIVHGEIIGETAKDFYWVADPDGKRKRVPKRRIHTEPCPSCRDHDRARRVGSPKGGFPAPAAGRGRQSRPPGHPH
jgi:hypothetical protein